MASILEKIVNPAWYKASIDSTAVSISNYYRPMFRSSSVTPLWHIMIGVSVVMYTSNYLALKGENIQAARQQRKDALHEYQEKHGITDHH
eukprot:CAMPEP_0183306448 /NCGR_PEP_ID=MMETSP0160_2-20130417/11515_1 /TAXON_ID=2839 ORGANISM="Odontella Sinensis, Strain Grunow 1884" /NCGR_SAMPLE_ID=MMETSP0160_2 /ASSEMBLY_ACC=CAM_ASM_000250 /LENGTH=89 /DNA_ID=CAMNT_0025469817 /DNA_START=63 /DNA_END=332 /DNA_ORIENTATION=+